MSSATESLSRKLSLFRTGLPFTFKTYFHFFFFFVLIWFTGYFGLQFWAVAGFSALIWPPLGIGVMFIFCHGFRFLPAFLLGAWVAFATSGAPLGISGALALGNTFSVLLCVYFLHKFKFNSSMEAIGDVKKLLLIGGILSALFNSTFILTILYLWMEDHAPFTLQAFAASWLGGSASVMIVGTFMFSLTSSGSYRSQVAFWIEALGIFSFALLINSDVFPNIRFVDITMFQHAYLIFPLLLWSAVRFRQRGVTYLLLVLLFFALYGIVRDVGPFEVGTDFSSFCFLLIFLITGAITGLFLASALTERLQKERRLQVQYDVMATLNRADSILAQPTSFCLDAWP